MVQDVLSVADLSKPKSGSLQAIIEGRPVARPFVKWAGGKRRLIPEILQLAPRSFSRYIEPFLGGGALALALGWPEMILNDANEDLINAYCVVRDSLEELTDVLEEHRRSHSEEYFYALRAQSSSSLSPVNQAARFIYLNKTCFNGLYRVNRQGQFNVPFGRYKNPSIYDISVLTAASEALEYAHLSALGYAEVLELHAQPGDFIYLDPPYIPVSRHSDFKRYTESQFHEADHIQLAQTFNELVKIGAYPILSNSFTPLAMELYSEHNIVIVEMNRNINKNARGRGAVPEILVVPKD